jgi:REP element-mobilizing transposase RayT
MPSENARPSSGERQRADKGYLPRLAPEFYRGRACVLWTATIDHRATGWLTRTFHHAWQLTLLHTCARWNLACPAYVLMPDHVHLLWLGLDDHFSDQRVALEFLRKNLRATLAPHDWQKQAHDRVLREHERERGALQSAVHYLFENPVRAQLSPRFQDYAHLGCCVAGYPELDVRAADYWERFWRVHNYLVGPAGPAA